MMLPRRAFAKVSAASVLSQGFSTIAAQPRLAKPNVLIVLADDQGYGDFSAHGHPVVKTPNLDLLEKQSVRFTDFHASPMCTPTRAQLLTGRNALFTRAMNVSSGRTLMRTDLPTLPEVLSKTGYRTGIFGKWHLGDTFPYRPQDRGFQETLWFPSSHIGSVPDAWNNDYFNDQYRHNGKLQSYQGYSGDVFFDQAMRWIDQSRQPFFAYVPLNVAHTPLFVPDIWINAYREQEPDVARYYGMVANLDHNMGRLMKFLSETGRDQNTILIYTSDNGATPATLRFNAGMRGHKTQLYDGGHRVPFYWRWPQAAKPKTVDDLCQMQDLFPTLIDICGAKQQKPNEFDGVNLTASIVGDQPVPERTAVVQFSRMNDARPKKNDATIMRKKWRLVNGNELYDVGRDPAQEKNLFAQHPEVVGQLQSDYDRWWKTVEPFLDDFVPVVVGAKQENPVLVSACEWADVFLDQSSQVRRGQRKNGIWHLQVARAGRYEISLRRWPRDCDAAIAGGVPKFNAGVAIPISKARLRIGDWTQDKPVAEADREITFARKLAAGKTTMQSWFLDERDQALLGAYYAYVHFLGA
jgi:arylsulfatase A-like enzyme